MSILIVQHVAGNTLGPLEALLTAQKLAFQYLDCHQLTQAHIELDGVKGLIILGGKESAADDDIHPFMKPEQQLIRNAISQKLPVFGICLGSQMIARSLGATVERNRIHGQEIKEIGWIPMSLTQAGQTDPVISKLEGTPQFQWHEDTFHLPPDAVLLAASDTCPRQAYKLTQPGQKTYAVQFHPEVSLSVIQEWLRASESLDMNRKAAIWEESERAFEHRHSASRAMFNAFVEFAF